MGLCVRCGRPGEIVHHKIHLTPQNINDPSIALGEDNLELLCRDCHAIVHEEIQPTAAGLMFDANGNLVEREAQHGEQI
jgi:5-methylcytosine-specific restriction endonuclease McrA